MTKALASCFRYEINSELRLFPLGCGPETCSNRTIFSS
jgi:hypothetical protein